MNENNYRNQFNIENNDVEINQDKDALLPSPKFISRPVSRTHMSNLLCKLVYQKPKP